MVKIHVWICFYWQKRIFEPFLDQTFFGWHSWLRLKVRGGWMKHLKHPEHLGENWGGRCSVDCCPSSAPATTPAKWTSATWRRSRRRCRPWRWLRITFCQNTDRCPNQIEKDNACDRVDESEEKCKAARVKIFSLLHFQKILYFHFQVNSWPLQLRASKAEDEVDELVTKSRQLETELDLTAEKLGYVSLQVCLRNL